MLKFEENYWEGKKTLENECPWIVPSAAHRLDGLLNKDDYVIEIGTGGSTLFYAKRCGFVQAIETDPKWGSKVYGNLVVKDYRNTRYLVLREVAQIRSYFEVDRKLGNLQVTVISIDTIQGYNRSALFELLLCKYLHSLRVIVLDNYAEHSLWPHHWFMTESQILERVGEEWICETYDDCHWYGNGTRLLIKE